jgi:hypothetical protein
MIPRLTLQLPLARISSLALTITGSHTFDE